MVFKKEDHQEVVFESNFYQSAKLYLIIQIILAKSLFLGYLIFPRKNRVLTIKWIFFVGRSAKYKTI